MDVGVQRSTFPTHAPGSKYFEYHYPPNLPLKPLNRAPLPLAPSRTVKKNPNKKLQKPRANMTGTIAGLSPFPSWKRFLCVFDGGGTEDSWKIAKTSILRFSSSKIVESIWRPQVIFEFLGHSPKFIWITRGIRRHLPSPIWGEIKCPGAATVNCQLNSTKSDSKNTKNDGAVPDSRGGPNAFGREFLFRCLVCYCWASRRPLVPDIYSRQVESCREAGYADGTRSSIIPVEATCHPTRL